MLDNDILHKESHCNLHRQYESGLNIPNINRIIFLSAQTMKDMTTRELFFIATTQLYNSIVIKYCSNSTSEKNYLEFQSGSFDLKIHLIDYLINF